MLFPGGEKGMVSHLPLLQGFGFPSLSPLGKQREAQCAARREDLLNPAGEHMKKGTSAVENLSQNKMMAID